MKIKIITGFREDQQYSIDSEEAHKAYYLFLNPDKRGVFSNGLALIGGDIRRIEPDWQGTMGWSPTHKLTDDDWVKINYENLRSRADMLLGRAKEAAQLLDSNPSLVSLPLSKIDIPTKDISDQSKLLSEKFKT